MSSWLDRFKKPTPRKRVTVPDADSDMPTISARVPRAVKDWIRDQAIVDEVPMSDIVRMIVVGAYEDRELIEHEEHSEHSEWHTLNDPLGERTEGVADDPDEFT